MSLDLIINQFALQGDKMSPPQSSPTGFVNYLDGYTKDYEISLASGNPQAKAVERQIQNYLFGQSTAHQMAWEQQALPPWFSDMPGGYKKNAMVVRLAPNGDWQPYRSLVAANIDDPLTSTASWEFQPTIKSIVANVPMPAGAGTPANEIIGVATDFNALVSSGTWEFLSDQIVQASPNRPSDANGMLEVKSWTNGTPVVVSVQRYLDATGQSFVRGYNGTSWTSWRQMASVLSVRNGAANWCVATVPTANNYVLAGTPSIGTRVENLRLQFNVPASNTSAVTIDDGNGQVALVDRNFNPLGPNSLVLNGNAEITWNSKVNGGVWVLHWCDGAGSTTGEITPVGAISPFAMNIAPAGWLVCDGSAKSRSTYADLFAKIGTTYGAGDGSTTFNLPDLRGEFVRGWDNGRGLDPSRVFGSTQVDDFKSHTHGAVVNGGGVGATSPYSFAVTSGNSAAAGGTETRPHNVAMLYCIKAFSAVNNPGSVDIMALLDGKADRASFANLKAANGWQKLEGGVIIQWGSAIVSAGVFTNVTFPIAFPSACQSVAATIGLATATQNQFTGAGTTTNTGFQIAISSGTSVTVRWMAIGY